MPIEKLHGTMARVLLHQTSEEDGIPEPTILVTIYDDNVELSQEQRSVLINKQSIAELIRVLRDAAKNGED